MKTYWIKQIGWVLVLGLTGACQPQKPAIEGQTEGLDAGQIYLWESGSRAPYDSAAVTGHRFRFDLPALKSQVVYIGTTDKRASFFWSPAHIPVKLYLAESELKIDADGAELNNKLSQFTDFGKRIDDSLRVDSCYQAAEAAKAAGNDSLAAKLNAEYQNRMEHYWDRVNAETDRLIAANRDNAFGLYLFGRRHVFYHDFWHQESIDSIRADYQTFGPKALESVYPAKIEEVLAKFAPSVVGQPASGISGTTPEGQTLNLSDLKGKYVLVDFWASWCYWCRLETPNIKKAVSLFPASEFEVLGVSFDSKAEAWRKAIEEDQSQWKQIIVTADERSQIRDRYAFSGIPHILLVDPQGKIVARALRGEQIIQAIANHLKPVNHDGNDN